MVLGRVERYTVQQGIEGVTITLRQSGRALMAAVFAGGALLAIWWFGPYGPYPLRGFEGFFFWLVAGFWALFIILGAVGACYHERWTISEREICITRSFDRKPRRFPRSPVIKMQAEIVRWTDSNDYRLHLLGENGQKIGAYLEFQSNKSLDEFLKIVRPVLSLELEDRRLG